MRYETTTDFYHVAHSLLLAGGEHAGIAIVAIAGERLTVCDEAVVAYDGDIPIGMATISPDGEDYSGRPEIVGVFVVPGYQRRGVGSELLLWTLTRCQERGFATVRLSTVTKLGAALVARIVDESPVALEVCDYSSHSPI